VTTALADLPTLERVLRLPLEGEKRRRVLGTLAVLADQGRESVAVRELAERAQVDHQRIWHLVTRLEKDGFVAVDWSVSCRTIKTFAVLPEREAA